MTPHTLPALHRAALDRAAHGLPVLPLRAGKLPMGNCGDCRDNRCGGRPNMKTPGPCACPHPCHGWAAAANEIAVITSPQWSRAWQQAEALAYHPGGAGVTVVDLDNPAAVSWAQKTLPPTVTVATTRGEHWIYRGVMRSHNAVRPGVDIKSYGAYARWLGPGTGTLAPLPAVVRALAVKEDTTTSPAGVVSSTRWDRTVATGCRHTDRYVRDGLDRGLSLVRARTESGAASQAYGVAAFLAARHRDCPGPCGLEAIGAEITAAAVSVGVPEPYAARAVARGMAGVS
ncbi:DNA primase [Streptomyces carpaticus]|uniref:DNA primase n=1 Tax=Streptomyces carpaticus TaxID=285558 RepID=A0ABV4ZQA0_9ACTN